MVRPLMADTAKANMTTIAVKTIKLVTGLRHVFDAGVVFFILVSLLLLPTDCDAHPSLIAFMDQRERVSFLHVEQSA